MLKTFSKSKHPQYTYTKGSIFYYSRAVPKDMAGYYSTKRIVSSLRTKSSIEARIASRAFSAKLEQYWLSLRIQSLDIPALSKVNLITTSKQSGLPLLSEARDLYFSVKGKGRPKLFFDTANRNVRYLIECLGDNPLDCYSSKDAATFREWLTSKGLSTSSLQRIFSGIKAIISFAILEQGLDCSNPFTRVYIPTNNDVKKRHAIHAKNIERIQSKCIEIDDDIRWLVALISDSGMRLSEAAGLMISDINLDAEIPHINLAPHPHRRLKTSSSKRLIPLVGMSLWAAKRLVDNVTGDYCFPRYTNSSQCNSNSASATLNKWIKANGGKGDVIHGFRHSFRDRLRAIEAPSDLIDQLGGWTLRAVGQGYGDGYKLDLGVKYMLGITAPE